MTKRPSTQRKTPIISEEPSDQGKKPIIDDRGLAFAVYILYFFGYVTGITAFIGVIIAYFQSQSASSEMRTHFTFQVRTFWIGLLYGVIGIALLHIGIGIFFLLWGLVWSLVRNVRGILAVNRNEPIPKPESWMFGN